jgi:hypothetical protein
MFITDPSAVLRTPACDGAIGFVWVCLPGLKRGLINITPYFKDIYGTLTFGQIGFVFSPGLSQYASRSTQYEDNWLRFSF